MTKNVTRLICVVALAMILTACTNADSKVNQVIQNQIQGTDKDVVQSGGEKDPEVNDDVSNGTSGQDKPSKQPGGSVDVDLTKLSSTMVYSEVYNMMYVPDDFIGKTVRMKGMFVVYYSEDGSVFYPAVIVADATACCAQGLEFLLEGNPSYPEGYPRLETEITVVGTFETYDEDGYTYCRLQNARIE